MGEVLAQRVSGLSLFGYSQTGTRRAVSARSPSFAYFSWRSKKSEWLPGHPRQVTTKEKNCKSKEEQSTRCQAQNRQLLTPHNNPPPPPSEHPLSTREQAHDNQNPAPHAIAVSRAA